MRGAARTLLAIAWIMIATNASAGPAAEVTLLEQQERDFDPDPKAVAHGIERHLHFLRQQGFLPPE